MDVVEHEQPLAASRPRSAGRGPGRARAEKLARILDAAEEEFALAGLRGARVQRIADRAGLPKANVLYYFRSKTAIYRALLTELVEDWNAFLAGIRVEDDPAVVLDALVRAKVDLAWARPRASKLFAQEIIAGAPVIGEALRGPIRRLFRARTSVVRRWIDDGRMAPVDPDLLLFLIWSSTQHYADFDEQVRALSGRRRYDDALRRRVADFLSHAVLATCGLVHAHD